MICVHLPLPPNLRPKSASVRFGTPDDPFGSCFQGRLSPTLPSALPPSSIVLTVCCGGFGGSFGSLQRNLIEYDGLCLMISCSAR